MRVGIFLKCRQVGTPGSASLKIGVELRRLLLLRHVLAFKSVCLVLPQRQDTLGTKSGPELNLILAQYAVASEFGDLHSLWRAEEEPDSKMPFVRFPAAD